VTAQSKLAERLLAHARLCRQIALASSHETTRIELERIAEQCDQAAAQAAPYEQPPLREPLRKTLH